MALLKNRLITLGVGLVLSLSIISTTAWAVETPTTVCIGLESTFKNASTISIGNETIAIGNESGGVFQEGGILYGKGGFTVTPLSGIGFILTDSFTYEGAMKTLGELSSYGFSAVPCFMENGYTVYVSGATVEQLHALSGRNAKAADVSMGLMELKSEGKAKAVLSKSAQIYTNEVDGNIQLGLGQQKYRGRISLNPTTTGISVVNIVGLEEYLYGVIPQEMPATYEVEALKAQAVAARTYAVKRLSVGGGHKGSSYQLCDSIHCQVYKGQSGENARTTQAVKDTASEIILYNNQPIDALFSASSGGYTEDSENVWLNKFEYLRGKPEQNEIGALEWERTITLDDLNALLTKNSENIGQAKDMVISKISSGGRVQELRIVGTTGEVVLTKESVRTYFSGTKNGSFPSKMFTINGIGGTAYIPNNNSIGTVIEDVNYSTADGSGKFAIKGKGNGHGCGLSQMGANGMALMGSTYDEILKYYYTGVSISNKQNTDLKPEPKEPTPITNQDNSLKETKPVVTIKPKN